METTLLLSLDQHQVKVRIDFCIIQVALKYTFSGMSSSNSDVSLQDYLVNSHNNIHNRIQAQNKPQQHQQQQQNKTKK